MESIKPCPFCGGRARVSRAPGRGLSMLCGHCGALVMQTAAPDTRDNLIKAWNKRTVRPNFSQASRLNPCPFCASRMDLSTSPENSAILQCGHCKTIVSFALSGSMAETVALWNRRSGG